LAVKSRPCQRCKALIPIERIEALPETRLCLKCSQEVGGDFEVVVTSENLAKTGSLKKNYGGWTIKKKRRPIKPKDE
jgi:Prokaryotic dksA/traR C4-type zinc finger